MEVGSVAAGAIIGAAATDVYGKAKDATKDAMGNGTEHGPWEMQIIMHLIQDFHKAWTEERRKNCSPKWVPVSLAKQGAGIVYEYKRRDYKHVSLLSTQAVVIDAETPIGVVKFQLNAGWNAFDLPDDTVLYLDSSNSFISTSVILYYGDDALDMAGV